MKNAVVAGVVLCAVACSRDRASQQQAPAASETSLAQRFAAKVRELDPKLRVEVAGDLEVRVYPNADSDDPSISYLDNLSRICEADPPGCDAGIDRFARTAVQTARSIAESPPIDPKRVRAVLKDDVYMQQIHEMMAQQTKRDAGAGGELLSRRFAGDLWTVYVEDSSESMRMIMTSDLADMKLDTAGLDALAMKNMREALPSIPYAKVDELPNVWAVTAGDSYDAARLMLHEQWKPLVDLVEGDLVVAVPTRDMVAFTGTGHPEAVEVLRSLAAQVSGEDAYALSAKLYRWTPDGWVVH